MSGTESKPQNCCKNVEGVDPIFCHRFSELTSEMMNVLNKQRLDCDKICDVRIVTEDDVVFYAHKSILSASSSFLKNKIQDMKPATVLSLGIHSDYFRAILDLIYTSKLTIKTNAVSEILRVSDLLKLNQVSDICRKFLKRKSSVEQREEAQTASLANNENGLVKASDETENRKPCESEDLNKLHLYPIYNISYPLMCVCRFCGTLFSDSWNWEVHSQNCRNSIQHIDRNHVPSIVLTDPKSIPPSLQISSNKSPMNEKVSQDQVTKTATENTSEGPNYDNTEIEKDKNKRGDMEVDLRIKEISSTDKKSYTCRECNSTFPSKAGLAVHIRSHTGERPYRCNVCRKTFTQLGHVQRHQKVHTGEKPFQCTLCNARVRDKASLHYHILAHNGIKPFPCDQCEAKFTKRSSLVKHKNVHTGKFLYQCTKCQASYREKASLSRHMKCQHNVF